MPDQARSLRSRRRQALRASGREQLENTRERHPRKVPFEPAAGSLSGQGRFAPSFFPAFPRWASLCRASLRRCRWQRLRARRRWWVGGMSVARRGAGMQCPALVGHCLQRRSSMIRLINHRACQIADLIGLRRLCRRRDWAARNRIGVSRGPRWYSYKKSSSCP